MLAEGYSYVTIEKQALVEAKLELKMEEEGLECESGVVVVTTRYMAVEEIESVSHGQEITFSPQHEDVSKERQTGSVTSATGIQTVGVFQTKRVDFYPDSRPFAPKQLQKTHGTLQSSTVLLFGDALLSVVCHLRKPISDIKKVGGDPLDYQKFMRQFNSRVTINCDDYNEKLNCLEQYTYGEASKRVSRFSYLDAEQGY